MSVPRNTFAFVARLRRASVFRDRRTARGGDRNHQREWLTEASTLMDDQREISAIEDDIETPSSTRHEAPPSSGGQERHQEPPRCLSTFWLMPTLR